MGISPDLKVPEGSANTGSSTAAGLAAFSTKTENQWRESSTRTPFKESFNPIGAIFQGLLGALQGIATGVFDFLDDIADLFQLRWDQVDQQGEDIQDLQDKTTNMTLSTGQATAYMTSSPGTTTSPTVMPFNTPTRPPKNVTFMGSGKWRLDIPGEWDITAQVEFYGGSLMPPGTHMQIIVRTPGGAVYDGVTAHADSDSNITVTNVTSTQIPTAGYTVEVRAWTDKIPILGGSFRGIRGGYSTTRLMMRKFEMEAE